MQNKRQRHPKSGNEIHPVSLLVLFSHKMTRRRRVRGGKSLSHRAFSDTINVQDTNEINKYSKFFDLVHKSSFGEERIMKQQKEQVCPVEMTLSIVGGRWKLPIVYRLLSGTKRFGELRRLIPDATQQMLTLQLRELEHVGILHRQVYAQVPPKVEYSLTELGRSLEPIIRQIYAWGEWYCDQNDIEHWRMSNDVQDHFSV